jgi:uncharacterized protein YggT (Ycf19 family)
MLICIMLCLVVVRNVLISISYQIISSFPSFQKNVMARFLSQSLTRPLSHPFTHTIAITTATTTTPITAAGRCVAWGAAAPENVATVGAWGCPSLIWETGTTLLVSTEPGVVEVGGVVVGVVTTTTEVVVGVVEGFVVTVVVGGGFGDEVVGAGFGVVVAGGVDFGTVVVADELRTGGAGTVVLVGVSEHISNNWLSSGRSTCTCFGCADLNLLIQDVHAEDAAENDAPEVQRREETLPTYAAFPTQALHGC